MTREEAIVYLKRADVTVGKEIQTKTAEALDLAIKALDQEPTTKNETLVSFGAYKQVAWERDVAIEQLHELGYEFGQKIESTTKNDLGVDAVSRQEAIDTIRQLYLDLASQKAIIDILKVLPSVTSQEPRIDFEELKRKILMEVDGGTDDAWLAYGEVCNRISNSINEYVQNIKALPSVTSQEPRWIPVSEKLPNDRDWYLGIFKEPDTGWINPLPFICDYVGRETKATTKGYWILRGFTDWDDYHIDYYFNLECVAWMSLPKAYSEVEE